MPLRDGRWTPAAVAQARIVARLRERGHSLDDVRSGRPQRSACLRIHGGAVPARRRDAVARGRGARDGARRGPDPPHLGVGGLLARHAGGRDLRRRRAAAALHGRGALRRVPARRLPAAGPRLRPGAGPDRRRRGEAVPSVRARAADPRRPRRAGDRRGDGGPGLGAAPARLADHGPRPPALAAALHRAGRGRAPGDRGRVRRPTSGACGSGSPSPTWPATPGSPRTSGRRRRWTSSSGSWRRCRTRCPRARA